MIRFDLLFKKTKNIVNVNVGDMFLSKHIHKINNKYIKEGDKIKILKLFKKSCDIKINDSIIIQNVNFDDIGEVKFLLYKDY